MNEKGFFMLPQIMVLSLLLLAASVIFAVFQTYSLAQYNENAHLTAIYLAQKEISVVEGQILSKERYFSSGTIKETSVEKNGITFSIKTSLFSVDEFKKISTIITWQIKSKSINITMDKTLYENN